MKLRLKRNDKIGLLFFIAFVASTILIYEFEERFDQERWRSLPSFRYEMAEDIVDSELFINKTKEDVIIILGEPNAINTEGEIYFSYKLGQKPSFFKTEPTQLILRFENNRVKEVVQENR